MKKLFLFLTLSMGSLLGLIKGSEARQKWAFKMKSRSDEKKQLKLEKKLIREGRVMLDEIEIAAFHKA